MSGSETSKCFPTSQLGDRPIGEERPPKAAATKLRYCFGDLCGGPDLFPGNPGTLL
jgi:hypothetical protein